MDIDAAIDRLLAVAARLDLPAAKNLADEPAIDALRAAVAPLRLPDDLVRLWRRDQGGPPGMIDRLDLMPVSQAIEFRGIHDGPMALLTIAYESQWSRFLELDDADGLGGGSVWEGDVGDFDWREVAPSLADLVDSVATAMELGIARPRDIGGFRILDWDEDAWGRLKAERWPDRRRVSVRPTGWLPRWLEVQGLDPRDAVPRGATTTIAQVLELGDAWTDAATISGRITSLAGTPEAFAGALEDETGRLLVFVPRTADGFGLFQNGATVELEVRPFDGRVDVGAVFDPSGFDAVATAVRSEKHPR